MNIIIRCAEELSKGKDVEKKLLSHIAKYPDVPYFKNQLESFYFQKNRLEDTKRINKLTREQHPTYIFGLLNEAKLFLLEDNIKGAKDIMGTNYRLIELFPERHEYLKDEFQAFEILAIELLLMEDHLEEAKERNLLLIDLLGKNNEISEITDKIRLIENYKTLHPDSRFIDIPKDILNYKQKLFEPYLFAPEIQEIINLEIPQITTEQIEKIKLLPKDSIENELITVLNNTIYNEQYYLYSHDEDLDDSFIIALLLLREIGSDKYMPKLIDFLHCNADYIDYVVGEYTTEVFWKLFYENLESFPSDIINLILNRNVYFYDKCGAYDALTLYAKHYPQQKSEIIAFYTQIIEHYLSLPEDSLRENDFNEITNIVDSFVELRAVDRIELIKELYDIVWINPFIIGHYRDVIRLINSPSEPINAYTPENFFELINLFSTPEDIKGTNFFYEGDKPGVSEKPKISRNDLCICGSGKKFKNCCIDKYN